MSQSNIYNPGSNFQSLQDKYDITDLQNVADTIKAWFKEYGISSNIDSYPADVIEQNGA